MFSDYFKDLKDSSFSNPTGTRYVTFGAIAGTLMNIMLGIAASLSVIAIIYAGIKYIMSEGNPKSLDEARNYLTYSIAAFVIAVMVYSIKTIILNILGVNNPNLKNDVPTF